MQAPAQDQKLSASLEDYLEAIVGLLRQTGRARVRDIAEKLAVAKPSVTVALRSLRDRDLVNYAPYGQVTLTDKGTELADGISKRHAKLSAFFVDILDMDRGLAEANACRIEHAIGDTAMARLEDFVEFMANSDCPAKLLPSKFREHRRGCGDGQPPASAPILEKGKNKPSAQERRTMDTTLADLNPGDQCKVLKVCSVAGAGGRLLDMGLIRGVTVTVQRVAPLGDPVEIELRGYRLSLRKDEAACVSVEKIARE